LVQPSLCCHCTDTHAAAAVSAVRSQSSYTLYTDAESATLLSTTHGLLGGYSGYSHYSKLYSVYCCRKVRRCCRRRTACSSSTKSARRSMYALLPIVLWQCGVVHVQHSHDPSTHHYYLLAAAMLSDLLCAFRHTSRVVGCSCCWSRFMRRRPRCRRFCL
jgi:hypothetical protein